MFKSKQAKKIAKHEKWIRELAASEALKTAEAFAKEFPLPEGATAEERQKEFEFDRQLAEKMVIAGLSSLSAEKYDIKVRLCSTLIKRCGRELALEFVEMVDFKALDEKKLMDVLIKVVQRSELCADRASARGQWYEFVEPYHAIVEKEIAALDAYAEEQARLRQEETRLRKKAVEENARLRAELAQLK